MKHKGRWGARLLAGPAVVALASVLIARGCSGGEDGPPGAADAADALERQFSLMSDGQYGRLYDELHPAQQELIDEETFVRCYDERLSGLDVTAVDVQESYVEETSIPGTSETVESMALTAEIELRQGSDTASDTDTYHEFEVDGRWTFVVTDVESFRSEGCE